MQSSSRQECRVALNLGVQDVRSLVSHVCQEVVHTEQDRELSETCAGVDVCSLPPRFGGGGIARSMLTRRGMSLSTSSYL